MIYTDITSRITDITPPLTARSTLRIRGSSSGVPNVVSIVVSRVIIETRAAARLIAFDAENAGLLYFLNFTAFTIATVNDVNVYAAMVIVVISW